MGRHGRRYGKENELIYNPNYLCYICEDRLDYNFAPYLFKKKYANKEKQDNGLWARPLIRAGRKLSEITFCPPQSEFNYWFMDNANRYPGTPILIDSNLRYDIEIISELAYKFSLRSTYEIASFIDYISGINTDAQTVRQCILWHFDYHMIYQFGLLPEFIDKTISAKRIRIYHEIIERGVYPEKRAAFICTMHENKFSDYEDACRRMLTRESYWRCGAFGREYEPPRIKIQ